MQPVAIVAVGAISPLGVGRAAFAVGAVGDAPGTRVVRDAVLAEAGQARPIAARAPFETNDPDRARGLLGGAAEMLCLDLDQALPDWRSWRLALCVGSSAGGMPSLERALGARARAQPIDRETARNALYDGPLSALRPRFGGPVVQVLAACASSTLAIGLGCRWLEAGDAELVIAGGYDALSHFVAAGFEALGATTASGLEPFRVKRDGMALGEGAVLVALVRADPARRAFGHVLGFAVTNDAVHVTAPDPGGRGLARAASAALDDAATQASEIGLVSAHATATIHNDSAETRAIGEVLGAARSDAVVHPFKATTGHCLGASGALETLAALDALGSGILPGARGDGPIEPGFPLCLLERNAPGSARICLKLSSGFGGSNAALVVGSEPRGGSPAPRPGRTVRVLSIGQPVTESDLVLVGRLRAVDESRLQRLSAGGALAATAVASALLVSDPLARARAGVVVGSAVGCIEENEMFDRTRRDRGPRAVEPKRFSRTSPNLPAAECAISFGFLGPAFAVGGGPRAAVEALLVGHDLVAGGDADAVVVVASDEVREVSRELFSAAGLPVPVHGARALVLGIEGQGPRLHRAPLAELLVRGTLGEMGVTLLATALDRATR